MIACPACAGENPAGFKFCGFCGGPLEAAPPPAPAHETRRSVTIVFSDLVGSTALGERIDSEAVREILKRYFEEMSGALEMHGGTVEKFIGDAIMAVFGMPVAHEDDALRAARATLEMKARLAVLNEELELRWGVTLANRTGINTGSVIASGDASTRQGLVAGDTVNTAARLEQAAPPYEVLIGEPTYRLLRGAVEVEEVEPLELKGKAERVPAYKLLAVTEAGSPPRRSDLPLIGRERELGLLTDALDAAISDSAPRFVTLFAEAGTGKSRLIEELMSLTTAQGGLAVRGRCLPYGRGITFWPLVEIVGQAAEIADDDPPETARAKIAELAGDAAVAERIAVTVGLSEAKFPLDELFWGVRKFLESLSRRQPVVAVFEDVHWAETAMLDLLSHVGSTAAAAPLLVVCSSRPDLQQKQAAWPAVPGAERLQLEPLQGEDIDRLVEHVLGGSLPEDARAQISQASQGNPLFLEQLVTMLVEEGMLHHDGDGWAPTAEFSGEMAVPASIEALLSARLDLLPMSELTVVESASVIGFQFPKEPVAELSPDAAADLDERLERIVERRLIQRVDDAVDVHRFHHIMIKDTAYNRLPKRTRSTLHSRFADWAERVNRERDREIEFQEIVGYHLEQARRYLVELAPLDDVGRELGRRAAAQLGPAGRRAFGRGDMWAASNLFRRSVDLLPEGSRARLELLPDLGESLMEIGEFGAAQEFLDEAVAGAAALGDRTLEADAILTRLLVAHHTVEDLDAWRSEVQYEAERLIPMLEENRAPAALAKAWRMIAFVHGTVCRWQETADALEHAIGSARLAGEDRQIARLSASYVMALAEGSTPAPEAIKRAEEVLARGLAGREAEAIALLTLSPLHAMSGDFERARELSARGAELLRDLGATVLAARTSDFSSRIELMAEEPGAAEERLRIDYDALTAMDERYFLPNIAALLAKTLFELDRLDEAEELVAVAGGLTDPEDVEAQALLQSVQARLLAARGHPEEAKARARAAVELAGHTDAPVLRADALFDVSSVFGDAGGERTAALEEARALYRQKQHLVGLARVEAELAKPPALV
jgi:class 3 adenylate cyclase/tetratricopeptide (TPR) repeat protein